MRGDRLVPLREGCLESCMALSAIEASLNRADLRDLVVFLEGGEGLRRRVEREEVRVSVAGVFNADFGVDAGVCLEGALVAGLALCEPFGIFLELPLVNWISAFGLGVFDFAPVVDRLVFRALLGGSSNGRVLMRPDLRRPFSVYDVGPSADIFFHGGDSGLNFLGVLGGGVESRVRRLFKGRSSSWMWPLCS